MKLTNVSDNLVTWQTTDNGAQTAFTNVPYGQYQIEVSAAGYLTTQSKVRVMDSSRTPEIEIVLRRDPAAIGVDASDSAMPPKARKLTKHAIGLLKSDRFPQAQKQLDEAYRLAPADPDLNFLPGYLYFKTKDFAKAGGAPEHGEQSEPSEPAGAHAARQSWS